MGQEADTTAIVYCKYSFTDNVARVLPVQTAIIRAAPGNFTLSAIERNNKVHMWNNHLLHTAAFYYEWDYSGNPYYSDPYIREKLRNRITVASLVHLIQHPSFSSYQGMSNDILLWAWLVAHKEWDFLDDVTDRILKLRAHISLPEMGYGEPRPNRGWGFVTPQHYATTTEPGTWREQRSGIWKSIGYAVASDWHKFMPLLRRHVHYFLDPWPDEEEYFVEDTVSNLVERLNNSPGRHRPDLRNPSGEPVPALSIHGNHYITPRIHTGLCFSNYPDFYDEMQALIDSADPVTRSPFLREENFVRSFPEVDIEGYEGQSGEWSFLSENF